MKLLKFTRYRKTTFWYFRCSIKTRRKHETITKPWSNSLPPPFLSLSLTFSLSLFLYHLLTLSLTLYFSLALSFCISIFKRRVKNCFKSSYYKFIAIRQYMHVVTQCDDWLKLYINNSDFIKQEILSTCSNDKRMTKKERDR